MELFKMCALVMVGGMLPAAVARADDSTWIDAAVQEALDGEQMPGTSGEPEPGRAAALRAFFTAHPEYKDDSRRARLWDHACGLGGAEAAHAYLTRPPKKTPLVVEVTSDTWRVFLAHADVHCTSDDWSWYSADANQAAMARGAQVAYGSADHDTVVVKRGDKELVRVPLTGQGFLALQSGKKPASIPYDPTAIEPALDAYYGPPKKPAPTK